MPYVQEAHNALGTSGTSVTLTFGSPIANHGTVVGTAVGGRLDAATPVISSIVDDKGNTYTVVDSDADAFNATLTATFILENITNAPTVITITWTAAMDSVRGGMAHEVSGCAQSNALDKHAMVENDSPALTPPDQITTGNVTPATDGQYVYCSVVNTEEAFGTYTVGTGFTGRISLASGAIFMCSEDLTQTTAAAVAGTWTPSSIRRVNVAIVTIKAAVASATLTPTVGAGALTSVVAVPVVSTVKVPVTP